MRGWRIGEASHPGPPFDQMADDERRKEEEDLFGDDDEATRAHEDRARSMHLRIDASEDELEEALTGSIAMASRVVQIIENGDGNEEEDGSVSVATVPSPPPLLP